MRIAIRHMSRYQYDQTVPYALQRLRLRPRPGPGQAPVEWRVTVDGAEPCASYLDGLGNHVDLASPSRDVREIVIVAEGVVDTTDMAGIYGVHDSIAPPWIFERETVLTRPGKHIQQLADALAHHDRPLDAMHSLMIDVYARVAYTPGASGVDTEAEAALRDGRGVCQDHTHIMIAVARRLGLPARYVSGYLLMNDAVTQTAGHAWAEVYLDGLGWIGFDAANKQCPDERYVRVACGFDYRDACPVSGVQMGQRTETMCVDIRVEAVPSASRVLASQSE